MNLCNAMSVPPVTVRRDLCQNVFTVNVPIGETPDGQVEIGSADLPAGIWRRDLIISAIIRMKYSADKMEAITMNVLADLSDVDARNEHRAMQQWRKKAKHLADEVMQWAAENDLATAELEPSPDPESPDETIEGADGIDTLSAAVILAKDDAADLEDEKAMEVPELFPLWADQMGKQLKAGERYTYRRRLYKVLQDHTAQASWAPDVAASLFTEVAASPEQGTHDNPIPYNNNMALEEGKYYSQGGVTYLCIRSTGVPVYNNLADLVGIYVQVA